MNLDEKENYRQDEQYFQDNETRYEEEHQYDDIDIDAPPADRTIDDNSQQGQRNNLAEKEINSQRSDDEIPNSEDFDNEFDDEFDDDDQNDPDLENDEDFDDDEAIRDPNRPL